MGESIGAVTIRGVVERGDARGRTIGFPTANIALSSETPPTDGVYAGSMAVTGLGAYQAAVNIGRRPTFYATGGVRLAEAHLLDFEGDLYGYRVELILTTRLRSEMTFRSVDDLVNQLRLDVQEARRVLGELS